MSVPYHSWEDPARSWETGPDNAEPHDDVDQDVDINCAGEAAGMILLDMLLSLYFLALGVRNKSASWLGGVHKLAPSASTT